MTDLPPSLRPFVLAVPEGPDVQVHRAGATDLYRPAGTARTGAILFVHGGPGPAGLEATPRDWPVYRGYATAVARRGVTAAVVDHSLIHGLDRLADAADEVEAAVGVLRSDARVDPDRVGLWFFSGAGLLAGEWLDSRPDWLRFVALTYPLLATPPGVGELVSAAEVIGRHNDLPVLLTRAGREREQLAGPVAEFVSAGGTALDIIDVPKGHHGFDMLDPTEESREAVTKALDWAIAHLGEEAPDSSKLLVPPPAPKSTRTRRSTTRAKTTVAADRPAAPEKPPEPAAPEPVPAEPVAAAEPPAEPAPVGPAGPQLPDIVPPATETAATRLVAREHAAYAAHDLEAFLAVYSPTARIELPDGTELKGRRLLREYYRPRFETGQCKTEVVQRLTLGAWVVEHIVAYDTGAATEMLAVYRVTDDRIAEVRFRV